MNERERLIKQAEETFGLKAVPHGEKRNLSPLEKQFAEALIEQAQLVVYRIARFSLCFSPEYSKELMYHPEKWEAQLTPKARAVLIESGYLNTGGNE